MHYEIADFQENEMHGEIIDFQRRKRTRADLGVKAWKPATKHHIETSGLYLITPTDVASKSALMLPD